MLNRKWVENLHVLLFLLYYKIYLEIRLNSYPIAFATAYPAICAINLFIPTQLVFIPHYWATAMDVTLPLSPTLLSHYQLHPAASWRKECDRKCNTPIPPRHCANTSRAAHTLASHVVQEVQECSTFLKSLEINTQLTHKCMWNKKTNHCRISNGALTQIETHYPRMSNHIIIADMLKSIQKITYYQWREARTGSVCLNPINTLAAKFSLH